MRLWKFGLCFQQPLLRATLGDEHVEAQVRCALLLWDSASAEGQRNRQSFSEESRRAWFYCLVWLSSSWVLISTDGVVFILAVKLISFHHLTAASFRGGNGNSNTSPPGFCPRSPLFASVSALPGRQSWFRRMSKEAAFSVSQSKQNLARCRGWFGSFLQAVHTTES